MLTSSAVSSLFYPSCHISVPLSSWRFPSPNFTVQHGTDIHRSPFTDNSERALLRKPFISSLFLGFESGNAHMTPGNTKPCSTETSALLVLLCRISKLLVRCTLWFVNSEHSSNVLCLCYFRMLCLRPVFRTTVYYAKNFVQTMRLHQKQFTQLPQESWRGNWFNNGHCVLECDLQGWSNYNIPFFTGIFALVSVLEMQWSRILTLHFLQFRHIQVEKRVDALSFSISIYIQLYICWQASVRHQEERQKLHAKQCIMAQKALNKDENNSEYSWKPTDCV